MNKIITYLVFSLFSLPVFAQCDFDIIDFKDQKLNATPREMFVLQENEKALIADYILFSLFTDGVQKKLLTTFSRVARHQFVELCFNATTKLQITLKDKSTHTLVYEGKESCQTQKKHPSRKEFNTLKIEGSFLLTEEAVTALKQSKVTNIDFITKGGVSYPFKVVKKIEDAHIIATTYPATYFMNYLPCIEL